jgi:hypothetical protein
MATHLRAMEAGDRSSNGRAAEESRETITARSVLPRTGPIQNHACGVAVECAMRFLAKSHHKSSTVSPQSGISPAEVAGWAVARFIAEVGECRKAKPHAGFVTVSEIRI